MKQALLTMLQLQDRMNHKVHPDWAAQNFAWYRAIWIECGELMDHYGYKWWKHQRPEMQQVQLEVIDIWHFGLSALFAPGKSPDAIADSIVHQLDNHQPSGADVREATEALAAFALNERAFSVPLFWDLMLAAELQFDDLYRSYVGKNVLNFFRQDHGYQEGSYIKTWLGREDNEHLVEILAELDWRAPSFGDDVYESLRLRYARVRAEQSA